MRGRNENLEAKAELALGGADEIDFRKKGCCFGGNVSSVDEVLHFDPTLEGGFGGVGDGVDGSDNNGSNPTGTRFKS